MSDNKFKKQDGHSHDKGQAEWVLVEQTEGLDKNFDKDLKKIEKATEERNKDQKKNA